ncbi:MAG TPA: glycosyltransferase [Actinomycetota bacterium]|nr:glycosyltransferase [Actinomycetota bacterium]
MTGPLVTVVVLNYNGAERIPGVLESLAAQDLPADQLAVWVVDNASADGSLELLARDFPWVRTIANPTNDGFAGGNNVALREVATPFVALLNDDAYPSADWLRRLLEPFQQQDAERVAAVSAKIVFLPRFLPVELATPGFVPGALDGRELGVRVYRVSVDGRDVTDKVLWDRVAYGPEGDGPGRFRWTRPAGTLLVPVEGAAERPLRLGLRLAAETAKPVDLAWPGGGATAKAEPDPVDVDVEVPVGVGLVDVLNNAGSMVFRDGYGADRAYQELDRGQYQRPEEVFAFCGGAVCFRTEALREAGSFDEDFFLYYEDTDLSWRLRALGWAIRYQPEAVVRHIHSASSVEWSPLFVFHTDRNRLLMLTKNARAGLATREVLRYPLTTVSLALREVARSRHTRRRPPLRPTLLRLRVLGSYLRLLPVMLVRRRRLAARSRVDRRHLERWLVLR